MNPEVSHLDPAQVFRGMPVKVTGMNFDQATEISVRLNGMEVRLDKPRGENATTFTFRVPLDIPLGAYTVRAVFSRRNEPPLILGVPVPSQGDQLRVISDTGEKLKVTGISPLVGYPVNGKYGFTVLGEGFSQLGKDNELICSGRGMIDVNWVSDFNAFGRPPDKVYGRVVSSRQLEFIGVPQSEHKGLINFQVRVGDSVSEEVKVTFARVPKGVPWLVAVIVLVLLLAMVWFPVTRKLKPHKCGAYTCSTWETFLLDQATDTLSLSKFQLYVWTGVAIFGYTYLTVARSLIQGDFQFAPIPEGLPGILAVAGGTAAVAAGVNTTRGPKGAGEDRPSFVDLISVGGVVVAERFQFLVWTVLGALAFLFLVLFSDPATIKDLPKVPEGFLYMMGISSAGYLGGKLARKPGPVLDTVVAQRGSLIIEIQGRNLSQDATFIIDDREVTYNLNLPNSKIRKELKDADLEVIRYDDVARQDRFALALRLTLDEKRWLEGGCQRHPAIKSVDDWINEDHRLCLINPDGQKAVQSFKIMARGSENAASLPTSRSKDGSESPKAKP